MNYDDEIIRIYLAGASIMDTVRATGVSKWRVEQTLNHAGVSRPIKEARALHVGTGKFGRPEVPLPDGSEALIIEIYTAGKSARAIAKGMGIDHHRVTDIVRNGTGSEVLPKGGWGGGGIKPGSIPRGDGIADQSKCSRCKEPTPLDNFVKCRSSKYGGLMGYCRQCWSKIGRKASLKRNYGMTESDYTEMLDAQGGVCAICGDEHGHKKLSVDHCHTTGKIRGILCHRCNVGIGLFRDNVEYLKNAQDYLSSSLHGAEVPEADTI